jgi:hypothetical protein
LGSRTLVACREPKAVGGIARVVRNIAAAMVCTLEGHLHTQQANPRTCLNWIDGKRGYSAHARASAH